MCSKKHKIFTDVLSRCVFVSGKSLDTSGTDHDYRHMDSGEYTRLEDELHSGHTDALAAKITAERRLDHLTALTAVDIVGGDEADRHVEEEILKKEVIKRQIEIGLINGKRAKLEDKKLKYQSGDF